MLLHIPASTQITAYTLNDTSKYSHIAHIKTVENIAGDNRDEIFNLLTFLLEEFKVDCFRKAPIRHKMKVTANLLYKYTNSKIRYMLSILY